ncbi:3-oxoacyl-ACP synthase III [Desulfobotulus sp. H1]|uniref:3-oxoacyl-ACP synthase III n=1 Tax=Desulfobotulus pelophilus TaxID=2823377 RepID=A0ABT3N7A8_9BACT|nr:3-oxoacyl-ACP synthase III [Desulfobotulus pelophilus]MCW7753334.1 3-oxoacyl-ACP synthase III [Desulfobotulus pelophilus]
MLYSSVVIRSIAYELPSRVVTSKEIEERLAPLYSRLRLRSGQLEALTGVRERRQWEPGEPLSRGAIAAGQKSLESAGIPAQDVDMLIYAAVCRENLEPATACSVAHGLGLPDHAHMFDLSNACLGMINGLLLIADAIESGRIRNGMVVACESSRQIMDITMDTMLATPTMDVFTKGIATLTGGSGAAAMVLSRKDSLPGHSLLGGVLRNNAACHDLCVWGPDTGIPASAPMRMRTDAAAVLHHGVHLGISTFTAFLRELSMTREELDRIVCHQVGAPHRQRVLSSLGIPLEKDYPTFPLLGNMGTVSLPLTAAVAAEQGFILKGHRVGFFGIGSGLNCLMLALDW